MSQFEVGNISATAVLTAKMRALESEREGSQINDQYAALLVEHSGLDLRSLKLEQVTGQRLFESNVVRTHFLDNALLTASANGVRQVVILGSGLDTRAARLDLPHDCVVFEIDQLAVITYKKQVLADRGVPIDVDWRPRGGNLEGDWLRELTTAGFDSTVPTAWIIEGVLFYFSDETVAQLIQTVSDQSAAGSELLAVHFGAGALIEAQSREMATAAENAGYGFKSTVADPVQWLDGYGWDTEAEAFSAAAERLGRTIPYDIEEGPGREIAWLIRAVKR
ncbi:SAM-dependent methyltransferase [Nocardia sp. 348MFTsu5.1]|uniref:class I SAM-dependent methyltransferase n=1 Tax=Nocardia sp. 348MFTsu5.1 TaxID=1172185 RepID=UPI0003784846|nr:SAM-dependent methyltransferase [Nocardia sp. 348MFTsu5.1]